MRRQWYLSREGEQYGPYSWEEIVCFVREGKLGRKDLLWSQSSGDWQRAEQLPGLFSAAPSPGLGLDHRKKTGAPTSSSKGGKRSLIIKLAAAGMVIMLAALFLILTSTDDENKVRIDEIFPLEGPVGTSVTITGRNFGASPGENTIYFNETEAWMLAWSDTEIRAKVPPSTETGTITLIKDGERVTGDTFTIREKQLELMAEETITPSAEFQEINHEEIGVLLPPEFTAKELPLVISRVSNAPGYVDEMYADTPVYKITMGDKRQFDDYFRIRIPLDEEMEENGPIRLAYWDEDFLEWTPLPTEVDEEEGFVYGYTDHLTMVRFMGFTINDLNHMHLGGDHFIVAYDLGDIFDIEDQRITDINSMALHTGSLLDQIYNRYNDVLGDDYSPDYFYGERSWWDWTTGRKTDTRPIVWIDSKNNEAGGIYNWKSRRISLPTSYASYEELATTIGHELFHAFQHNGRDKTKRLTIAEMAGGRRWLMEATAEYAAYYVATDIGLKRLHSNTWPQNHLEHFSNREDGHEYGMAAFIHFLVEEGADFGNMWRYIVDNRPMLQKAFEDYVLTTVGSTTTSIYREFWHRILADSKMPGVDHLNDLIPGFRSIAVRFRDFAELDELSETRKIEINQDWSMNVLWVTTAQYDNDGKALINVEPEGEIPDGVRVDVLKVANFNEYRPEGKDETVTTYNKVPGGKEPVGSLYPESERLEGITTYLQFEMDEAEDEILIITAYGSRGGVNFDLKISQLSFEVDPAELLEVDREEEYEFTATIYNVPRAISDITFRWKLENGKVITEQDYKNHGDKISDTLEFSFSSTMGRIDIQNLEVEVFDSADGTVIESDTVMVEKQPEVRILGDRNISLNLTGTAEYFQYEHSFEAVASPDDTNHRFQWNFGDGHTFSEEGKSSTYNHIFEDLQVGDEFRPTVELYSKEGEFLAEDNIFIKVFRENGKDEDVRQEDNIELSIYDPYRGHITDKNVKYQYPSGYEYFSLDFSFVAHYKLLDPDGTIEFDFGTTNAQGMNETWPRVLTYPASTGTTSGVRSDIELKDGYHHISIPHKYYTKDNNINPTVRMYDSRGNILGEDSINIIFEITDSSGGPDYSRVVPEGD